MAVPRSQRSGANSDSPHIGVSTPNPCQGPADNSKFTSLQRGFRSVTLVGSASSVATTASHGRTRFCQPRRSQDGTLYSRALSMLQPTCGLATASKPPVGGSHQSGRHGNGVQDRSTQCPQRKDRPYRKAEKSADSPESDIHRLASYHRTDRTAYSCFCSFLYQHALRPFSPETPPSSDPEYV